MFDYLQQFNALPKDLRDRVSSPSAMAAINELENKYQVDLAMVVMKVMIKSLAVKNLPSYFIGEGGLAPVAAESLAKEFKEKILAPVTDYLGMASEMRAIDLDKDIDLVIREAGLVLPSTDLVNRFKNILSTYLKGIRSKIDARATFSKAVNLGGLNLGAAEIDRVFKVCETQKFKSIDVTLSSPKVPVAPALPPQTKLDKLIASAEKSVPTAEYDLKQSLAERQAERPAASGPKLDLKHELPIPDKTLDLPEPAKAEIAEKVAKVVPPVAPKTVVAPPAASPAKPAPSVPPIRPAAAASVKRPVAANRPVPAVSGSKPKVQDIRPMPKVMGPIEELQFLDLVNFRRLGATPAEITARIFSKIKLLERDGYDRMIAGVKAWRQSPVNRLYLRLGQEAIAKGMTLKDLLDVKQKDNQEHLKMEEVEALVGLNSKLVF